MREDLPFYLCFENIVFNESPTHARRNFNRVLTEELCRQFHIVKGQVQETVMNSLEDRRLERLKNSNVAKFETKFETKFRAI